MRSRNRVLSGILSCLTCLGSVGSAAKNEPAAPPAGEATRKKGNGGNKKGDRNAKGIVGIVPGASTTTPRSGLSGRDIGFFAGGVILGGTLIGTGPYFLINKVKDEIKKSVSDDIKKSVSDDMKRLWDSHMKSISDRKKIIDILVSLLDSDAQFVNGEAAIGEIMSFVELIAGANVDDLVYSPSEGANQHNPGPDKFLKSLRVSFDEKHDPMNWGSLKFTVDYKKLEEKSLEKHTKGSEFYEATFKATFNLKEDVEEFVLKPVKISALYRLDGEELYSYDGVGAVYRGVVLYILSKFFDTKVNEFIKKLEDERWVHVIDLLSDILRLVM